MTKRSYITAKRLAAIRSDLKPVQMAILQDVARLNVASGRQLRRLHYPATSNGRRMARLDLLVLINLRVLARLNRRIGGERSGSEGFVYALDVAGQRLTTTGSSGNRHPWTPGSHHLQHALAVSELYVRLREATSNGAVHLEQFDAEPHSWRFYRGPGGASSVLKPDAYAVTGSADYDDSWFIEMDRSTEPMTVDHLPRLAATSAIGSQGANRAERASFQPCFGSCPDDSRQSAMTITLAKLPPEYWHLFRVITHEAAAEAICSGQLINTPKEVNP